MRLLKKPEKPIKGIIHTRFSVYYMDDIHKIINGPISEIKNRIKNFYPQNAFPVPFDDISNISLNFDNMQDDGTLYVNFSYQETDAEYESKLKKYNLELESYNEWYKNNEEQIKVEVEKQIVQKKAYLEKTIKEASEALDELTREAQEWGMYE